MRPILSLLFLALFGMAPVANAGEILHENANELAEKIAPIICDNIPSSEIDDSIMDKLKINFEIAMKLYKLALLKFNLEYNSDEKNNVQEKSNLDKYNIVFADVKECQEQAKIVLLEEFSSMKNKCKVTSSFDVFPEKNVKELSGHKRFDDLYVRSAKDFKTCESVCRSSEKCRAFKYRRVPDGGNPKECWFYGDPVDNKHLERYYYYNVDIAYKQEHFSCPRS